MINLSKIADSLEKNEISNETDRMSKLFQTIYFSQYVRLGEIRDIFDSTPKEELKMLFNMLKDEDANELDGKILGEPNASKIFRNSYWNDKSSSYYWQKLKINNKSFI